eukprot:TRINITY_DN8907_c0_g1_i1.p1 TRINITY_DN8907_c0_g1~~TRINITY_DN8907_c0_g1_i1.p1  ORF type:complete len:253 (+),score=51.99 TRINITY_DN8907_c0_g1_i1:94-852(+)
MHNPNYSTQPYPPPGSYNPQYPPTSGGFAPQGGYPPQQQGYPPQSGYPSQAGYQPGGPPMGSQGGPAPPNTNFRGQWYSSYYNQIPPQELQTLQMWFTSMDRDRSGSISANELANVAIGGMTLGLDIAVRLIRVFDVDKNGTIDFYEYASLHKFLMNIQSLFQMADRDRSGRLDQAEIGPAVASGGFRVGPTSVSALYRKYNKTGYGLTMVDFIGMVAHIAQVKSLFESKDTAKTGSVNLNFDQLTELTTLF